MRQPQSRKLLQLQALSLLLFIIALHSRLHGCSGQGEAADGSASTAAAPMEEKEKRALYAAIEGFVGKGWNGSALYPDPCGWSPIQVSFLSAHTTTTQFLILVALSKFLFFL
jgi:hypothetical protein